MNIYCFVKQSEFNLFFEEDKKRILSISTSRSFSEIPLITLSSTDYHIIEAERDAAINTVLKNYIMHDKSSAQNIIDSGEYSESTISYVELKVSQGIGSFGEVADTYVIPANVDRAIIREFSGNSSYTQNAEVQVIWDYDVDDEILWSTRGSHTIQMNQEITDFDGSKELALVCSNGELGTIQMSGRLTLELVTS